MINIQDSFYSHYEWYVSKFPLRPDWAMIKDATKNTHLSDSTRLNQPDKLGKNKQKKNII